MSWNIFYTVNIYSKLVVTTAAILH